MQIYYINSEKFLNKYNIEFLQQYTDNLVFKSQKRLIQYTLGRYLVKSIGQKHFNINNPEIEINNNKPRFKNSNIKFSITHCDKYIAAAFDKYECGLDIEKIKKRDLKTLSIYYKKEFNSLIDFYRFWTEYEAGIKLQTDIKDKYSIKFDNDYILTVVSENSYFLKPPEINEINNFEY